MPYSRWVGKKKQKALKEALRLEMKAAGVKRLPKTECCVSKDRCNRCPIRMLKEGSLPEGYTVRKRKLVKVTDVPVCAPAAALPAPAKKSKKKSKKQPLAA